MAKSVELPESYFWEYFRDTYATSQAVAIRRQAEVSSRVTTLGRLIAEIRDDHYRISRQFFVAMWDDPSDSLWANQTFDENFAGEAGGDHLDPAIPASDLENLATTADTVKRYVDENIAHSDARRTAAVATFNDLDAGIDAIGDLYAKYTLALTAVGYVTLVPVIQHNWKAIFTRPWIEPPPHLRRSTPER